MPGGNSGSGAFASRIGTDEQTSCNDAALNRINECRSPGIGVKIRRSGKSEELENIIVRAVSGRRVRGEPALAKAAAPDIAPIRSPRAILRNRAFRESALACRYAPDDRMARAG
jgi:hypothetical protein